MPERDIAMTPAANELIPRRAVLAVAVGLAALLATLALRGMSRVTASGIDEATVVPSSVTTSNIAMSNVGTSNVTTPHGTATGVGARTLHFRDRSDGGIDIVDASTLRLVETLHGEQGFVRGTLRSFARERKRQGFAGEAPLHLQREDRALWLSDPATGQRLALQAFGPTNVGVFARWLD